MQEMDIARQVFTGIDTRKHGSQFFVRLLQQGLTLPEAAVQLARKTFPAHGQADGSQRVRHKSAKGKVFARCFGHNVCNVPLFYHGG